MTNIYDIFSLLLGDPRAFIIGTRTVSSVFAFLDPASVTRDDNELAFCKQQHTLLQSAVDMVVEEFPWFDCHEKRLPVFGLLRTVRSTNENVIYYISQVII